MRTSARLATVAIGLTAMVARTAFAGTSPPPVTLATDPAGDWTAAAQDLSDVGAGLGQDLTSASMDRIGSDLEFIIGVEDVRIPDPARRKTLYEWHFTVDGRDDGYVLYGPCTVDPLDLAFYGCTPSDALDAEPRMTLFGGPSAITVPVRFDETEDTISITVPMAAIGARSGSVITDDVTDSVEASLRSTPDENGSLTGRGMFVGDNLMISKSYRVPRS